jgi:transcriptional regulator with XRE-family HTH domain
MLPLPFVRETPGADMGTRFSERVNAALSARQWRPADLARAVGASRAAVSHWTSGRSEPSGELLTAIADALGVTATWLARGVGPQEAPEGVLRPDEKQVARAPAGRHDVRAHAPPSERHAVGAGIDEALNELMADITREAFDLVRAWIALPETERDRVKRQVETLSLQWRRHSDDKPARLRPPHRDGVDHDQGDDGGTKAAPPRASPRKAGAD